VEIEKVLLETKSSIRWGRAMMEGSYNGLAVEREGGGGKGEERPIRSLQGIGPDKNKDANCVQGWWRRHAQDGALQKGGEQPLVKPA